MISKLVLILLVFFSNKFLKAANPEERKFLPLLNISCYVCETSQKTKNMNPIEWKVKNDECTTKPEIFKKICDPAMRPRGCGKIFTRTVDQLPFAKKRVVELISRFCSSADETENGCNEMESHGGIQTYCLCSGDFCNYSSKIYLNKYFLFFMASIFYVLL